MSSVTPAPVSPKRLYVAGDRAATVVGALAKAQGHQIVENRASVDLYVLEPSCPEQLDSFRSAAPRLIVTRRRLRDKDSRAFENAGADRVFDAEASILCVAFALSELLFPTLRAQRQYGRQHGGIRVCLRPTSGSCETPVSGRLVDIARAGAFVATTQPLDERVLVAIEMTVGGHPIEVRGRVAFVDKEGCGIEFARDDEDVAPKLSALCEDAPFFPPSGSTLGLSAAI